MAVVIVRRKSCERCSRRKCSGVNRVAAFTNTRVKRQTDNETLEEWRQKALYTGGRILGGGKSDRSFFFFFFLKKKKKKKKKKRKFLFS